MTRRAVATRIEPTAFIASDVTSRFAAFRQAADSRQNRASSPGSRPCRALAGPWLSPVIAVALMCPFCVRVGGGDRRC